MAGLGITFHAEQRRETVGRQFADELAEISPIKDLAPVPLAVFGRKLHAGALADALTRVLVVLQVPEACGRCELLMVSVTDTGTRERGLEPCRVGPGVLGPAHAATLAYVEHDPHVRGPQSSEEALKRPAVNPDCGDAHQNAAVSSSVAAEAQRTELEEFARDIERFLAERPRLLI
jgi:hypothetical protein